MEISGYITQLGKAGLSMLYTGQKSTRDSLGLGILSEDRLALLDEGDREGIDAFVQRKIGEQESRILIDWDADSIAFTGNEVTSAKAWALAD